MKLTLREYPDLASHGMNVAVEARAASGEKLRATGVWWERECRGVVIKDCVQHLLDAIADYDLWGHVHGSEVYEHGGGAFFGGPEWEFGGLTA